jgi:hypothetical protein
MLWKACLMDKSSLAKKPLLAGIVPLGVDAVVTNNKLGPRKQYKG